MFDLDLVVAILTGASEGSHSWPGLFSKRPGFFYASHLLNPPSPFGQHVAKDFAAHLSTKESPWVETGAGNSMRRWRRMRIKAFELADLTAVWSEMLKRKNTGI